MGQLLGQTAWILLSDVSSGIGIHQAVMAVERTRCCILRRNGKRIILSDMLITVGVSWRHSVDGARWVAG